MNVTKMRYRDRFKLFKLKCEKDYIGYLLKDHKDSEILLYGLITISRHNLNKNISKYTLLATLSAVLESLTKWGFTTYILEKYSLDSNLAKYLKLIICYRKRVVKENLDEDVNLNDDDTIELIRLTDLVLNFAPKELAKDIENLVENINDNFLIKKGF